MVGANAATGNRLMAELCHGLVERPIRRFREHAARTRAEQLARMIWVERARHEHADPFRHTREAVESPLRWLRLS
jgi:hypothetical protein